MNITYTKENEMHKVCVEQHHKLIGDFCIDKSWAMSISIEEEYQGKGISKQMIQKMISSIELADDHILCIDVDASDGFWDYIGMKLNRYGLDYRGRRTFVYRGYEKTITWRELKQFAYSSSSSSNKRGGKMTIGEIGSNEVMGSST
jgi:hypothetical protein